MTKLGQNFLLDTKYVDIMLKSIEGSNDLPVLEIGPGRGILTKSLLMAGYKVYAIEKDKNLFHDLEKTFKKEIKEKKLFLFCADIRDFINDKNEMKVLKSYFVVANIPYYITGIIIRNLLENKYQPQKICMMIQKEVAERITRKNNKESILSLSVAFYGSVKYLSSVPRDSFSPTPKVDSAIILIENIKQKNNSKEFFKIINTAFKNKRKQIGNNLANMPSLLAFLKSYGYDKTTRAEDIPCDIWEKSL